MRLPTELPLSLQALWHDEIGDWKTAHDLIDQLTDQRSAHIHAYPHRKEGDIWNADYWYKIAGLIVGETLPGIVLQNKTRGFDFDVKFIYHSTVYMYIMKELR